MAPVPLEHVVARLQRAEQVEALNAAARTCDKPVALAIDERRSVVRLSQLARDQADDAGRPILSAADERMLAGLELPLHELVRLQLVHARERLALLVEAIDLGGERKRFLE